MNRSYSTFGSTLLTVTMRWTDRLIGIASTLILARLLMPDDFGIIAMASLAVALAEVLLSFGVHVALIRDQDATQEHYDTAWTIRLGQTAVSTLLVILLAPFAADYFDDQRVGPVLQLLAFGLVLGGLENIGIVEFQKRMQFGAEFRFVVARRIVGFAVTVTAAFLLKSYWALVIGTLTSRAFGMILSYLVSPMRPRLSLAKFQEIFSISQWMLLNGIGAYLQRSLHTIFVGRWTSTATTGAYSLAEDISSMPSGELLAPINRALFPAFSQAKASYERLKELFLLAQSIQTLIAVPAAVGLAVVAEEAVPILLGEAWRPAIPYVQILALVNIVSALTASGRYVLIVLGRLKATVVLLWSQVMLFAVLALTFQSGEPAMQVALFRLAAAGLSLWLSFWVLIRAFPVVNARDVLAGSIRPLAGAGAMAMALIILADSIALPDAQLLLVKVVAGAAIYSTVVAALWLAAGRPAAAESYIIEKARTLLRG